MFNKEQNVEDCNATVLIAVMLPDQNKNNHIDCCSMSKSPSTMKCGNFYSIWVIECKTATCMQQPLL